MPTSPNATESLSGGSGITQANLVKKVLLRLDDNPATFTHTNAPSAVDTSLTVTDSTPFQIGGWVAWIEDGTFDLAYITAIPNGTTLTIRRGHRGATAAIHAANAVFAYMPRYIPHVVSDVVTEQSIQLWPDLYEVRHVDWTISTSVTPEVWFETPTDCERVAQVYQRTNSTPVDLRTPGAWGGVHFLESSFVTNKKALQVYGTAITSPDSRLHAIYLARLAAGTGVGAMTTDQISILVYEAAAAMLETAAAGESKPDRRPNLATVPTNPDNRTMFLQRSQMQKRKEIERLQSYLPRRNRMMFRGGRHYAESGWQPNHPVRPW